jgi:hypothetical protein
MMNESNDPLPTDLSFASIDELIEELMNRVDAGIIMLRTDTTKDDTTGDSAWTGDPFICMGLCDWLNSKIITALKKEWEDGQL